MFPSKIYSISQVNRYIRGVIDTDFILKSIWVKGEISNYKHHSSGHLYFTLKDKDSTIKTVMFKDNAGILPFIPEDGMEVTVCGYISVYEKTGQYQLYAELMEPMGVGSLTIAFEQMKAKLTEEGLFDPDFKRDICKNPEIVAIITSPTGAAIQDIINIAQRRNKSVQLVLLPVLVQGDGAAASIVNGLKMVNEWGKADTIILGRGGGSIEDLCAFNEEAVARAIFASVTPIISAVGHETDFTIADFVSDMRAPTPSAAAELAINDVEGDKNKTKALKQRLNFGIKKLLDNRKKRLEFLMKSRAFKRPYEGVVNSVITLDRIKKEMEKSIFYTLQKKKQQVSHIASKLELLSPLGTLKRGYSVVFNREGKVVSSTAQVKANDFIDINLKDGKIVALVKEVSENNG